jgi:hypothetical protein
MKNDYFEVGLNKYADGINFFEEDKHEDYEDV